MNPNAIWIFFSAWIVVTGWGLSLIKQLNAPGYAVSVLLFIILLLVFYREDIHRATARGFPIWRVLRRRFLRPLPFVYLIYLLIAIVGGALYAPSNYDALCYRIPRILHWWSDGGWHWISGWNARMDYSATGFEWFMAPLIILFKSDRCLFLINIISYSLLPGLIYSSFTGLGISKRVAWSWMWILPCAYCFALQAGSLGNDTFAAVYFLGAVVFALRAVRNSSWPDAMLSLLSAALLTGAKASNLPLLLPLLCVMVPLWRICLSRPFKTLGLLVIAMGSSFLPIAMSNYCHLGDWAGDPQNLEQMKLQDPASGLLGNALQISIGSLAPPLFPMASEWKKKSSELLGEGPLHSLQKSFPRINLNVGEIQMEEGAGLGLGITLLILVSMFSSFFYPDSRRSGATIKGATIFGLLTWAAFFAYMAKMGSESGARLVAAYYPGLLLPFLSMGSQVAIVRQRWWRVTALICMMVLLPALLLNPARPLIPIDALIGFLESHHLSQSITARARTVYSVYGNRSDSLSSVREKLPEGAKVVGFAGTSDESEYSFWKPLGDQRIIDLMPVHGKIPSLNGIDCIVGSEWGINDRYHLKPDELTGLVGGEVFWSGKVAELAGREPMTWYVIVPGKVAW